MVRDLLGKRIKKIVSPEMQIYMEKYYIYNDKVFQIVRIKKVQKMYKMYIDILVQNVETEKLHNIFLPKDSFLEKKLYFKKPQLKKRPKFKYNCCYFENKKMKENFHIMRELYEQGYKNYSRMTAISFHHTKYTIIENGKFLTCFDDNELNKTMKENKIVYRDFFEVYKVKSSS